MYCRKLSYTFMKKLLELDIFYYIFLNADASKYSLYN